MFRITQELADGAADEATPEDTGVAGVGLGRAGLGLDFELGDDAELVLAGVLPQPANNPAATPIDNKRHMIFIIVLPDGRVYKNASRFLKVTEAAVTM